MRRDWSGGSEVKPAIQKMVAARSWVAAARKPRSWMEAVEGVGSQCHDDEGKGEGEVPLPTRLRLLEWWCEQDDGSGFSAAVAEVGDDGFGVVEGLVSPPEWVPSSWPFS